MSHEKAYSFLWPEIPTTSVKPQRGSTKLFWGRAFFFLNFLLKVQSRPLEHVLWQVGKLLRSRWTLHSHFLPYFLKRQWIKTLALMKLTTFRTVDKNSLRISGSDFIVGIFQLRNHCHGFVWSSFLHQGGKAMGVAKPQRCSICATSYQAFSCKLSFPWQRNASHFWDAGGPYNFQRGEC